MNERIKELAKRLDFPVGLNDPQWAYENKLYEFAELIVEECRYVMDCNKGSDQHTEWNRALSETSEKIREHFGVEE